MYGKGQYRKVESSRPVYYSIYEHFWGATNQQLLYSRVSIQFLNSLGGATNRDVLLLATLRYMHISVILVVEFEGVEVIFCWFLAIIPCVDSILLIMPLAEFVMSQQNWYTFCKWINWKIHWFVLNLDFELIKLRKLFKICSFYSFILKQNEIMSPNEVIGKTLYYINSALFFSTTEVTLSYLYTVRAPL